MSRFKRFLVVLGITLVFDLILGIVANLLNIDQFTLGAWFGGLVAFAVLLGVPWILEGIWIPSLIQRRGSE